MSMTVAQQKVKVKGSGSHLKRIRGAWKQPTCSLGCKCILLSLLACQWTLVVTVKA